MSITQGAPLPDITQTTTTADQAPDYYKNYLTGLSTAGQTAMNAPASSMIAGLDPLQQQGYAAVPDAATAYQPGLQAAQTTAGQAAQGIDPNRISALMNPYTQNVTDEMARLSQQNMQRNIMPSMKAGFVGSGALGSQRYANAMGQSMADVQSNLTGQQYGALSSGYSQAQNAALQEAQLKNQAAQTQGTLAGQAQTYGLTGAGALSKAGADQQAYQQSILNEPMAAATAASGLMKGYTMPNTQTSTFVGPKAGSYQTSDLANVMGVLTALGSGTGVGGTGTPLGTSLAGMGKGILNSLTGTGTGSNTNLFGQFNIDPKEFTGGTTADGTPLYFDSATMQYYDPSGNVVAPSGE